MFSDTHAWAVLRKLQLVAGPPIDYPDPAQDQKVHLRCCKDAFLAVFLRGGHEAPLPALTPLSFHAGWVSKGCSGAVGSVSIIGMSSAKAAWLVALLSGASLGSKVEVECLSGWQEWSWGQGMLFPITSHQLESGGILYPRNVTLVLISKLLRMETSCPPWSPSAGPWDGSRRQRNPFRVCWRRALRELDREQSGWQQP